MKDNSTTLPIEAMTPREKLSEALLYTLESLEKSGYDRKAIGEATISCGIAFHAKNIGFHEITLHLERATKIMEDLAECQKHGARKH